QAGAALGAAAAFGLQLRQALGGAAAAAGQGGADGVLADIEAVADLRAGDWQRVGRRAGRQQPAAHGAGGG
ncbi:hypothetical protein, partial [Escherichia coli]|uniref:hypothetical protein n=1 Tax=Escherichia coli TaxID=562 RepID=UPI00207D3C9C